MPSNSKSNDNNSATSYQELNDKLNDITEQLRGETLTPDQAQELYKSGLTTIQQLNDRLASAENTIKKLEASHNLKPNN